MPYLSKLSSHKLGSMTVQKIISQTQEADAASLLLSGLPEKTRNELLKK
jgi:hypothetical protein